MSTHSERVLAAFSAQADAFEDARFNRAFTTDASWLFDALAVTADDLLLDVAAGTGHAAREFAPRVRAVVALDLTAAMLARGKRAAAAQASRNVLFMRGDARALPFLDASFDIVVTRFALHHIEAPRAVLAEMVRCVKPGGQVVVADMLADDDGEIARRQDRLERLRDPSHARLLSGEELLRTLRELGAGDCSLDVREVERPLRPWLEQARAARASADAIRAELREEIAGGRPSGLAPRERDGELWFVQRWASAYARRAG